MAIKASQVSTEPMWRLPAIVAFIATPLLLASCGTVQEAKHPNSDLEELRVLVQVCRPDKRVAFTQEVIDLTGMAPARPVREERTANGYPQSGTARYTAPPAVVMADAAGDRATVRRWDYKPEKDHLTSRGLASEGVWESEGTASAGSLTFRLWTDTDKHQPVYETLDQMPHEIVALSISQEVQINGKPEMVAYWYVLPSKIPTGKFTDWIAPTTQETRSDQSQRGAAMFLLLTNGRKMPIRPVEGNPPKMRFKLMALEEYYNDTRFWARAQKAVAQKYYKSMSAQEHSKIDFVPNSHEVVPGC